jgi:hypothetical protein
LSGQEEEEEDGRQVRPRMRGAPGRGRPDRWVRSYTHYHPLDGAQVLQAALLDGRSGGAAASSCGVEDMAKSGGAGARTKQQQQQQQAVAKVVLEASEIILYGHA